MLPSYTSMIILDANWITKRMNILKVQPAMATAAEAEHTKELEHETLNTSGRTLNRLAIKNER